jgi:hypothetical protein
MADLPKSGFCLGPMTGFDPKADCAKSLRLLAGPVLQGHVRECGNPLSVSV